MQDRLEAKYPEKSWEVEITKLVEFIKSGNSTQVIGLPGVGRSNLLGILAYNRSVRTLHFGEDNQKKYHFVLMNFSEMKKRNESEVLKFYFISIMDSLKERSMEEEYEIAKNLLKEAVEIPDKQVVLQNLKKLVDYLALEKDLTLIFLIDRFEDYTATVTPEFFTDLRALRNRAKYKFSVVISSLRPIEELLEPEYYVDFFEFLEGNIIYLPLRNAESLKFRIEIFKKISSKEVSEDVIKNVIELTGGQGKLTRLSFEALSSEDASVENLIEFLLAQNKIKKTFFEIWNSLAPSEQKLVITNSTLEKDTHLEKVGLINEGDISIPLFKEFLTSSQDFEMGNEKIFLDKDVGIIKRGDINLSELLTSSEYKLLSFFIENEGNILDRDDVINSVWKDQSSIAGVSEQALDQLIFRLRKKIEENPYSPTHIQTIKGRGFKFTSQI